jgi:hypothetical protein
MCIEINYELELNAGLRAWKEFFDFHHYICVVYMFFCEKKLKRYMHLKYISKTFILYAYKVYLLCLHFIASFFFCFSLNRVYALKVLLCMCIFHKYSRDRKRKIRCQL